MKKTSSIIIGLIIVVVVVGAYAIFHKSNKTTSSNSSSSNAAAVNNAVLKTKNDSKLGQYLTDPGGKALYTYGSDSRDVSNCTGSCLSNWPAYIDSGSTTNLPSGVGTIKRTDNGQTQYTYNDMPLYYFASDSSGQVSGDGVENFHVAKPASSSNSSSDQSTTTQSQSSSSSGYPY